MKDIEEFKRRTGIKDVKLDTFNQLWRKWNQEHPRFSSQVTTTRTDEATQIDEETIRKIQERMDAVKKEMNERLFGDFTLHKKQREFWDQELDKSDKDDVYDADWEYAQKKLPKPEE